MYSTSAEWFWDNICGETICDRAGITEEQAEKYNLDDLLGDWAYDSEYIYEEDIILYVDTWDDGVHTHEEPNITDEIINDMAASFREYVNRR